MDRSLLGCVERDLARIEVETRKAVCAKLFVEDGMLHIRTTVLTANECLHSIDPHSSKAGQNRNQGLTPFKQCATDFRGRVGFGVPHRPKGPDIELGPVRTSFVIYSPEPR